MRSPLLLFVFAFFHCVLALSHPPQRRASINTPPNDAFYTPPDGWESKEPGTVLRTRKVNLAFLQIDDYNYEAAYQILYRTTGGYEDEPSTTVTTVIIPYNAKKNKLVNYLVYTDSNGAQCAPSYSMRKGGNFGTDLALSYQQILFTTFLNEGWILTVPDYQGPTRGFGAGRLEGRMALDAIRATLNYEPVGLSKNTKVVSYGYSGGAIASGWAAGLQPNYAPEINAVGFAMGGTPATFRARFKTLMPVSSLALPSRVLLAFTLRTRPFKNGRAGSLLPRVARLLSMLAPIAWLMCCSGTPSPMLSVMT